MDRQQVAWTGLDVLLTKFSGESYPLYYFPNVVLMRHAAYYSEEGVEDLQRLARAEIVRVLRGEEPASLVNKELLQLA